MKHEDVGKEDNNLFSQSWDLPSLHYIYSGDANCSPLTSTHVAVNGTHEHFLFVVLPRVSPTFLLRLAFTCATYLRVAQSWLVLPLRPAHTNRQL